MVRQKSKVPRQLDFLKSKKDFNFDRNVERLQNTTVPLIQKLPFSRLVREIMGQYKDNYKITAVALAAIQEASEYYLTYLFSDAYLLTLHRKRVTLEPSDVRMVLHIRSSSTS